MKQETLFKYTDLFRSNNFRVLAGRLNSFTAKTGRVQLIVMLFLFALNTNGQQNITVSGTKFTYPLIEKWITEYAKVNSNVQIKLVQKSRSGEETDLSIIAHQPSKEDLKENQDIIYAGRYAMLPAANQDNKVLATLPRKGLNRREIDKLFFEVINYDDEAKVEQSTFLATIYSRENQACSSIALAQYFGHISSEIRGKKVTGDDIYLLTAIKKDSIGLTYNNLGYLFDVNSRKLKDGLVVLPLDLKKDAKDILSGNLDTVLASLEKAKVETVPVEKFGFIYSQQNERKEISDFLRWVLSDGQKFNHEEGFLNLDKDVLAEQSSRLNEKFLTLK